MKKTIALTLVYLVIFSVMVGGSLLAPMAAAQTISANVDFDPDKINLRDREWESPYVMAFIRFPKPDRKEVIDINVSTVLIGGVVPAVKSEATKTVFKAFFDRVAFEDYIWLRLTHMGYSAPFKMVKVELTVTGKLYDLTPFEGSDTILVSAK